MPPFLPLDMINPSQIMEQYPDWIYFGLILTFFISVSGIILKRHFSNPYVKPLIVSVGLMLTVGIFRFKTTLAVVFEGWGIVGTILLILVVAIIPYGLTRSFGLSSKKSFYLTYILFYILSWIQFPEIYFYLGERNLGLVNLVLLIIFIIAIFKVVFSRKSSSVPTDLNNNGVYESEINDELDVQEKEETMIRTVAEEITKKEIKTIEDIAKLLSEIQKIIETHRNNLSKDDRMKISHILSEILQREEIYKKGIQNIRSILQRAGILDDKQLGELKKRYAKVDGKEKKLLKIEIAEEEKNIIFEKQAIELDVKLDKYMGHFDSVLSAGIESLRKSPYPYDAKLYLDKSRIFLNTIIVILQEITGLEENLIKLTKIEEKALNEEKKNA